MRSARTERPTTYDVDPHPLRDVGRWLISGFVRRSAGSLAAGTRVLDAGAGEAGYRDLFRHCRYVAVDHAGGDPAWNYAGLDSLANLTALPFPDATFDAVLLTEVLEHVTDPAGVLAEIRRVLRRGGPLFLTAPMAHQLHQVPRDYFRYTRFGLHALLNRAGFTSIELAPFGGLFTRWAYELPRALDILPSSGIVRGRGERRGVMLLPVRAGLRLVLRPAQRLLLWLERFDREKNDPLGWSGIAR